ncbi:hypothetical protein BDP27DRAFT_1314271 [Rhodocollybia butyracea]|uniref:Uncharacterized protein n=1 Tax=Rhodocollybia butyracea TaxID=206335 RepID=A0A9P5Q720_9AGAR|nr:hypothetical protein BDP27DRAFT_1314271 [Rhodocollybia butyracea]
MFIIARAFVALQAAAYLALVGLTPSSGLALATPFPMPMMMKNQTTSFRAEAGPHSKSSSPKAPSKSTPPHSRPTRRAFLPLITRYAADEDEAISSLLDNVLAATAHSNALQQSSESCPGLLGIRGRQPQQQQSSIYELSLFLGDLEDIQRCFDGADGLANFNDRSKLEQMIREIIDLLKKVLSYCNAIVKCSSLLSPLVGPLVYELKCFIEWLIDLLENVVDGDWNVILALLRELLGLCGDCSTADLLCTL